MTTFSQWLGEKKAAIAEKKSKVMQERTAYLAHEAVNVVEFHGQLYVSHDGIPIVPASSLNTDIEKVVSQSRIHFLTWLDTYGKYGKI